MDAIRRVLAGAGGVMLGLIGGVGLAKAGAGDLGQHVDAIGFHETGLFAWIQLFYGLLLVGAAVSWGAGGTTAFLGALAAGFGFVVLLTGDTLHDSLGVHAQNGVLLVVLGSLIALFGFLTVGKTEHVHRTVHRERLV